MLRATSALSPGSDASISTERTANRGPRASPAAKQVIDTAATVARPQVSHRYQAIWGPVTARLRALLRGAPVRGRVSTEAPDRPPARERGWDRLRRRVCLRVVTTSVCSY